LRCAQEGRRGGGGIHGTAAGPDPTSPTPHTHRLTPPATPPPSPLPSPSSHQELDLGGRQELWNLGPWLLRLRALRRVVVPRRAAAQSLFEALSLRNDPHQVEVVEEDADHEGAPPSDDDGDWGGDAEDWAGEGF
jgi:hypothetical protein